LASGIAAWLSCNEAEVSNPLIGIVRRLCAYRPVQDFDDDYRKHGVGGHGIIMWASRSRSNKVRPKGRLGRTVTWPC
jgi:hypothetical protein